MKHPMKHLLHPVAACLLVASAALSSMPSAQAADVTQPLVVRNDAAGMHVDNGIVAVDLSPVQGRAVASFKARTSAGGWREICESFRPDFKANPAGKILVPDSSGTPHDGD